MSASNAQLQASPPHAIIVSHGQPSDPDIAEVELAHLTQSISALMPGWKLHSATLAAPGALETALQSTGPNPLIYPLFMTDGWFTQSVLPKRAEASNPRLLPPLGVDASLPEIAQTWLMATLAQQGWQVDQTCLIIAAHGSGRSRNAARDTQRFADALTKQMKFADIRLGFIEEAPALRQAATDAGTQSVVLPFFASRREHVLDDIPSALKGANFQGVCLYPIGLHPGVPTMIADALIRAAVQA